MTAAPVALYRWTLLEGRKPGSPLIKGIATVCLDYRPADRQTHADAFHLRRIERLKNSARIYPHKDTKNSFAYSVVSWSNADLQAPSLDWQFQIFRRETPGRRCSPQESKNRGFLQIARRLPERKPGPAPQLRDPSPGATGRSHAHPEMQRAATARRHTSAIPHRIDSVPTRYFPRGQQKINCCRRSPLLATRGITQGLAAVTTFRMRL